MSGRFAANGRGRADADEPAWPHLAPQDKSVVLMTYYCTILRNAVDSLSLICALRTADAEVGAGPTSSITAGQDLKNAEDSNHF